MGPYEESINAFLDSLQPGSFAPCRENVLRFASMPVSEIKVVILGQDPYPAEGVADGYAFSSKAKNIPASLQNINKCLKQSNLIVEDVRDLSHWVSQGVLLLNASLTTRIGESNSHCKFWEPITDHIIRELPKSIIFVLWGKYAEKKEAIINKPGKLGDVCESILKWHHPSPLVQPNTFHECNHFLLINQMLPERGMSAIEWGEQVEYVYTDGACSNNGKKNAVGGYSVYIPSRNIVYYAKLYSELPPTNQRAEGQAIIFALDKIAELGINAIVITDSQFWMDMIYKHIPSWVKKGIPFSDKKNCDMTTAIWEKYNSVGRVLFKHIMAHGKEAIHVEHIKGNAVADKYACIGKTLTTFEVNQSDNQLIV